MKLFTRVTLLGIALVVLFAISTGAFAGQLPNLTGTGWWTSYQIQNVGPVTGTLVMTAYDSTSSSTYSSPGFLIGPSSALIYNPGQAPNYNSGGTRIGFGDGTQHLPSPFQGSVVLSSDEPMVAVANLGNNVNGSIGVVGGQASGFYEGFSQGATKLSFPTVKNNFSGQTTTFFVQAAGASSLVTMTYTMNDGSLHSQVTTIGANQMFVFDPAAATPPVASTGCGTTSIGSPCFGAAEAIGSTPIAGAVGEAASSGSPAKFVLSTAAIPSNLADTTISAPSLKNAFFGGTTGWSIQNTGGAMATVYMTFTVTSIQGTPGVSVGQKLYQSIQIDAHQSRVVSAAQGNIGGMPAGVFFAGLATSNQPLVSTVNETNSGTGKATYTGATKSGGTNKIAFPLVKEFFFGQTTSVTIQNIDSVTATVTVQYVSAGSTATQNPRDIGPGTSYIWNKVSDPANAGKYPGGKPAAGTNNAVLVTSTGGKIIGLAQEFAVTTPWSSGGIDVKNYNGFNLP